MSQPFTINLFYVYIYMCIYIYERYIDIYICIYTHRYINAR